MVLLNAREREIRAWGPCKGTDMAQRDWLIQAKSKLEATLKMCKEHNIKRYLHFSSVASEVQSKFPAELTKDFKIILKKHLSPSGVLEKEKIIELLLEFMEDKILDCTLGVNLDIVNYLCSGKDPEQKGEPQKQNSSPTPGGSGDKPQQRPGQRPSNHTSQQAGGSGKRGSRNGGGGMQIDDRCLFCNNNHSHMFYCEQYIAGDPAERFQMIKKQQACARCLGMKVKLVGRRDEWHPRHEKYCKTEFMCQEGQCHGRQPRNQFHITVCRNHVKENKAREADFVNSLDPTLLPAGMLQTGLSFLLMGTRWAMHSGQAGRAPMPRLQEGQQYEILPDVGEAAVFMMQRLPADREQGQELLAFYDTGCNGAGISDRGCRLLTTSTVRDGPTLLDVAGGRSIEIHYGDEQFALKLEGGRQLATITALHMPSITSVFPLVQLTEAWEELQVEAMKTNKALKLPKVDKEVGGTPVDILVGIKYLKYFPTLVFSLPSGLAVYRARFQSASGHQAVLGGPHAAWSWAAERAGHMNPRAFLTSEARAWCVEGAWVRVNCGVFPRTEEAEVVANRGSCFCASATEEIYKMEASKRPSGDLWKIEAIGADSPYRCVECRNCQQCKRGDILEEISFKEEAEQAMIEASVELDVAKKELRALLPFIEDPSTSLTPNKYIAEKVLKTQLALFSKRPDMREDTVRSHDKLVLRGHVKKEAELLPEERAVVDKLPGPGYFIPWRIVHNEGSLSTPCRMVFDASSKTPGGNSLNGVLAKGQNRLIKLQSLLAKFRQGRAALSADISMAYNGTKLKPEFYKFQRYLWKERLEEDKPTEVMCVVTLIYGVKPSGAQCQVSIEKLADHFIQQGRHLEAAAILKEEV